MIMTQSSKAEEGRKVSISFQGHLTNGELFGASTPEAPLRFTMGKSEVLPGVEQAVKGMKPGEKKSTTIPPESAYGLPEAIRIHRIPVSKLDPEVDAHTGAMVQVLDDSGNAHQGCITAVTHEIVEVDCNHPLAGETLQLDIELLKVE